MVHPDLFIILFCDVFHASYKKILTVMGEVIPSLDVDSVDENQRYFSYVYRECPIDNQPKGSVHSILNVKFKLVTFLISYLSLKGLLSKK